jgi:hypothetical protein
MTLLKYPSKPLNATPFLRMGGSVQPISGRNLAHGRRTAGQRAVLAADLVQGLARLEQPTLKQVAMLAGVSVPYVQAALRLSPEKRERIAAGRGSLCDAVRENDLLNSYRVATIKAKLGFSRAGGLTTLGDHTIA